MRMLLTPYVQSEAGIVILKPGSELLPRFKYSSRILVSDEPAHLKAAPSGQLPEVDQDLASNETLKPFLTSNTVILAAGGKGQMRASIARKKCCQLADDYCHSNLVTLDYRDSAIRLCWHHDNKVRDWVTPDLDELARRNTVEWVLERIRSDLRSQEGHQLTLPEVCWWSVVNQVSDQLPEDIARLALNLPQFVLPGGEMKEADIKPYDDRASLVIAERATAALGDWEQLSKPIINLDVDPEPPESFMLNPKFNRWKCEKYTQWVKTQACSCCGKTADDPHHIIGHGMGGMGTKAHDLFTIPLCRQCHNALHAERKAWEQENGSQLELLFHFLNRALAIRAILQPGKR